MQGRAADPQDYDSDPDPRFENLDPEKFEVLLVSMDVFENILDIGFFF